jgi:hypothetical protein
MAKAERVLPSAFIESDSLGAEAIFLALVDQLETRLRKLSLTVINMKREKIRRLLLGHKSEWRARVGGRPGRHRESCLVRIVNDIVNVTACDHVHFIMHRPTALRLRKSGLSNMLVDPLKVKLVKRVPVTRFLRLLAGARGVFSDGGSNQEELSYLRVPTILFRDRSERPDGIGANVVLRKDVGSSLAQFVESGGLDRLRQTCRLAGSVQPSETVVQALHRWPTTSVSL